MRLTEIPPQISPSAQSSFRALHRDVYEFEQTRLCPAPCAGVEDAKGLPTVFEEEDEQEVAAVKINFRPVTPAAVARRRQ